MKIDKQNGDVAFNEEMHKYFNVKHADRNYTSVTTLIGKYHEKFDSEFWSRYKALEKMMGVEEFIESGVKASLLNKKKFDPALPASVGLDDREFEDEVHNILASYQNAADVACERGTAYHLKKEQRFYEKELHDVSSLIKVPGEFYCQPGSFDLCRDKAILPEYLVYFTCKEGILHLAGQVDLIIKDGNDIYIIDYKTNAKGITSKAYFDRKKKTTKKMYYPITNIEDTTLMHYTLQLSLYAWMIQNLNPEFNIKMLRLLHVDGEGVESEYDLEYRKEDVIRLLKHYKKSLKIQAHRDLYKV